MQSSRTARVTHGNSTSTPHPSTWGSWPRRIARLWRPSRRRRWRCPARLPLPPPALLSPQRAWWPLVPPSSLLPLWLEQLLPRVCPSPGLSGRDLKPFTATYLTNLSLHCYIFTSLSPPVCRVPASPRVQVVHQQRHQQHDGAPPRHRNHVGKPMPLRHFNSAGDY